MKDTVFNINYEEIILLKNYWMMTFDPKLQICHTDHQLNNHPTLKNFLNKIYLVVSQKLNFSYYDKKITEKFIHLYFGLDCIFYLKLRYVNPEFAKNQREDILLLNLSNQVDINSYINELEKAISEKVQFETNIVLNNKKPEKGKL